MTDMKADTYLVAGAILFDVAMLSDSNLMSAIGGAIGAWWMVSAMWKARGWI